MSLTALVHWLEYMGAGIGIFVAAALCLIGLASIATLLLMFFFTPDFYEHREATFTICALVAFLCAVIYSPVFLYHIGHLAVNHQLRLP